MNDPTLYDVKGVRPPDKYSTLATLRFIGGLQTQRSEFASIDTRYGSKFMGGKPDSLIAGLNVEISNKLTLIRRYGNSQFSPNFLETFLTFSSWELVTPPSIMVMGDGVGGVLNINNVGFGYYYYKNATNPVATQSSFLTIGNTLYVANGNSFGFTGGLNSFKIVGPNLLFQSATFTAGNWNKNAVSFAGGIPDPVGGTAAFTANFSAGGGAGNFYQNYTPESYTPNLYSQSIGLCPFTESGSPLNNNFTYSIWVKGSVGQVFALVFNNQVGTLASQSFTLANTSWNRITLTEVVPSNSTFLQALFVNGQAGAASVQVYGAQLEIGTVATPLQITTTKPQGAYLLGIVPPVAAPTFSTSSGSLTPLTGYRWYYAYLNSTTGMPSNVSPISASSGPQTSKEFLLQGTGSADPQVDQIAIYRNVDGGGFWFQVGTVTNPGNTTWNFTDNVADTALNTQISAPIGLLNSLPPAGLTGLEFHAGRAWGFVGNILYYSVGPDNAAALNILLNAVSAEGWPPLNNIPFDAPITRVKSTNVGLLVFTTRDIWLVSGQDLTTFNPTRIFANVGLRSYNALDSDGASLFMYTSDRQFISITPSAGVVELGYPIGDQLELNFDPTRVYVARHVSGSRDNAIYIADGATGWYRINPNQVGASLSGEPAPVTSPFATIGIGLLAVASIETSFGVHQLLMSAIEPNSGNGFVLFRDLNTHQDFDSVNYPWSATVGSLVLATSGTMAETESITVEEKNAQPIVGVLLDEIAGSFENLPVSVPDPINMATSASLNSKRFYLSQGTIPPVCRHMQIQLSGAPANTADEILSIMIRGAIVPEQS